MSSIVINDVIWMLGTSGGLPRFTYIVNGVNEAENPDYVLTYDDGNGNWEIAFLQSGTLKFTGGDVGETDAFLVGGGQDGQRGSGAGYDYSPYKGGVGGKGGQVINEPVILTKGTDYPIVVGDSSTSTTGFGKTAVSGGKTGWSGINGAAGGSVWYRASDGRASYSEPSSGTAGSKAFRGNDTKIPELAGTLFGSSAGGGGVNHTYVHQASGSSDGGATSDDTATYPVSQYGAGGNAANTTTPKAGRANTGQGGGGGGNNAGTVHNGAPGGTGIVIIRPSGGVV